MKQKNFILTSLLLLFIVTVSAQQVSGTVTDETSDPISGVSIVVKGTSKGAITDFDGKYSIEAANGAVLTFSYVGFEAQDVTVTGATMDVQMSSGVSLSEIVLIGTRNPNRTAVNSAVPVDVIDMQELITSGPQVNLNQIFKLCRTIFYIQYPNNFGWYRSH